MGNPYENSYSFLFQDIPRILILANAYLRKICVKNALKKRKKKCREKKRQKGEEKETNKPYLRESLKGLLVAFRGIKSMMVGAKIATVELSEQNA